MKPEERGFTILEAFILIVILGVLAAIAVPQWSRAQSEDKLNELVNRLQIMRSQLELYRVQNDNLLPGQQIPGEPISLEGFEKALTQADSDAGFGPYLEKIPANPFVEDPETACRIKFVNSPQSDPCVSRDYGWWLNVRTGEFFACHSADHLSY